MVIVNAIASCVIVVYNNNVSANVEDNVILVLLQSLKYLTTLSN